MGKCQGPRLYQGEPDQVGYAGQTGEPANLFANLVNVFGSLNAILSVQRESKELTLYFAIIFNSPKELSVKRLSEPRLSQLNIAAAGEIP